MRSLALALCLSLAACGKPYIKPEPVYITQRVPVAVPAELTKAEPVPALEGDTVGAYLKQRVALLYIANLYAERMRLIRELPSDRP